MLVTWEPGMPKTTRTPCAYRLSTNRSAPVAMMLFSSSNLLQQGFQAVPGVVAGLAVGARLGWIFAGAHEAVTRFGELIGHAANPIGKALVFVNDQDGGRLGFYFGKDDETMDVA